MDRPRLANGGGSHQAAVAINSACNFVHQHRSLDFKGVKMTVPHPIFPDNPTDIYALVFNYDQSKKPTVDLEFLDGTIVSLGLASTYTTFRLPEFEAKTAKLVRDYARGKVTLKHVREVLNLPGPETPIEAFSREAQRQLDRIVSKSLEGMRVTEESDVDLDEEFEHGSVYVSLPSGVSDATIQRVLREFHNAPEFSNCEITINVEGRR